MHYGKRCSIYGSGFKYLTPRTFIEKKVDYEGGYSCEDLLCVTLARCIAESHL
jgi:hypothetical protein